MNSAINIISRSSHWHISESAVVLTKIYDEAINIALWQRTLGDDVRLYIDELLQRNTSMSIKFAASPAKLMEEVKLLFPSMISSGEGKDVSAAAFYDDVHLLLDMFACLFDATEIGLRINTLERAMCPRFHKDNVVVRLVTTYAGPGTEWLSSAHAYSPNNIFIPSQNTHPGPEFDPASIQSTAAGTVVLLKGEKWEGNEGRGIIHRSPEVLSPQKRLLLTCDLL
jgi:hypothetical protein